LGITTIMVTHDQEEALTMSDRIVVMSKGRIEQIGTPDEVYQRPASPFVADFIGRMNFLEGRLLADSKADCQGTVLCFDGTLDRTHGTAVTLGLRPEDIVVRNARAGANTFDAEVGAMEFMGNHFATTLHLPGSRLSISADLSMNDVRDLGIRSGTRIAAALPPDRLHVFAAP
jgi:iron(III) transport system ATP-binding protein